MRMEPVLMNMISYAMPKLPSNTASVQDAGFVFNISSLPSSRLTRRLLL